MTAQPPTTHRALLADGTVVLIRSLAPDDSAQVLELHQRMSTQDAYRRFFTAAPAHLEQLVAQISSATGDGHAAVGGFLGDELSGIAHYEVLPQHDTAEVAMVVDGETQAHGVGTLLMEQLVSIARAHGLNKLCAVVLAENHAMLAVLAHLGLPIVINGIGSERQIDIGLDGCPRYPAALTTREQTAETASLRHVLMPRSIAVVGASRRADAIGHQVLRNLVRGGYRGTVCPVNPRATEVLGLACVPTVRDLDHAPELAVVCVPAAAVAQVVTDCGAAGVPAAIVLSSGLSEATGRQVLASIREHGMRLVGPNCIGVANTDDAVSMNASFLAGQPSQGAVGVMAQSGGVAIAMTELLASVRFGVSTVVSAGDKYDVSGNDLLLWWRGDVRTSCVVLYLESFGNPRKFSRIARVLSREKPILTVRSGSSVAAQRAAASHTAAAATPAVTRDALFQQAGVIAVDTTTELVQVLAALDRQPLPNGNRVAVLTNAGGVGVLAADACARHELPLPEFGDATVAGLGALLPRQASITNPVDTTAVVSPTTFRTALETLLADDSVDAAIVAAVPTALGDPAEELGRTRIPVGKTVLRVQPGQLEAVRRTEGSAVTVSYPDPEPAAATLAHLARYASWRAQPPGAPPVVDDIDVAGARACVFAWLRDHPEGGWLDPVPAAELLRSSASRRSRPG